MSGGHAHRPQRTQSIPSHWASVGDSVVSRSECVELFAASSAIWPLCQTPPGSSGES